MDNLTRSFAVYQRLHGDYTAVWSSLVHEDTAVAELDRAIRDRIKRKQSANGERAAELQALIEDQSRPAAARRAYQMEFDELATPVTATAAELAALRAELDEFSTSVSEASKLRGAVSDALRELKATLEATKPTAAEDPQLARQWVTGAEEGYNDLAKIGNGV